MSGTEPAIRYLASALADLVADSSDHRALLPEAGITPCEARDRLLAVYHLQDCVAVVHAEMLANDEPLRDRLFLLCVIKPRICESIAVLKRHLSEVARHGGRGVLPREAVTS